MGGSDEITAASSWCEEIRGQVALPFVVFAIIRCLVSCERVVIREDQIQLIQGKTPKMRSLARLAERYVEKSSCAFPAPDIIESILTDTSRPT
jgi:hypothetical protein